MLLVLWVLGMVLPYTISGFVGVVLLLAAIVLLVRIVQTRRPAAYRLRGSLPHPPRASVGRE